MSDKYRKLRREHPFMPAKVVLAWAKTADASEGWEQSSRTDNQWEREVEGFDVRLSVEEESIFPVPNKHGDTDYGHYVTERGSSRWGWDGDWNGNWPEPSEHAPLGLPYTAIRFSGPGWVQGEEGGYFIPDYIEEQYDFYRRAGQSKSVAWDLTRQYVEDQLSMLFSSPLTNCVVCITVYKNDIELASTCMGTDVSGDDEGRDYIFQMVNEHDMIEDTIADAKHAITNLTN